MKQGPWDIAARGAQPGGRRGGGGGFAAGGGGGGGGLPPSPSIGNVVISPPTVERPPEATDFNTFGTLASRDNANTPAFFPTAQFIIPATNVGVVRSVSILANALLTTSDIRWTLFSNRSPVPGWTELTINPRSAGSVEVSWGPFETFIPVDEGATLEWQVTVLDAGTYQVSVAMHGWFYPSRIAGNFQGAYG